MIFVYIVLGLLAVCFVLVVAVVIQSKRVKELKEWNDCFAVEIKKATFELRRVKAVIDKTKAITEEANDKRQELFGASDAGLAVRANALFGGGVRDTTSRDSGT